MNDFVRPDPLYAAGLVIQAENKRTAPRRTGLHQPGQLLAEYRIEAYQAAVLHSKDFHRQADRLLGAAKDRVIRELGRRRRRKTTVGRHANWIRAILRRIDTGESRRFRSES